MMRLEHARRDDGGDRIGRVVQAVQEIEQPARPPISAIEQREGKRACRACSGVIDHEALDLVRDILEPVDDPFEMAVDFAADDEIHRRGRCRAP